MRVEKGGMEIDGYNRIVEQSLELNANISMLTCSQ